jgi:hypothetical protein
MPDPPAEESCAPASPPEFPYMACVTDILYDRAMAAKFAGKPLKLSQVEAWLVAQAVDSSGLSLKSPYRRLVAQASGAAHPPLLWGVPIKIKGIK